MLKNVKILTFFNTWFQKWSDSCFFWSWWLDYVSLQILSWFKYNIDSAAIMGKSTAVPKTTPKAKVANTMFQPLLRWGQTLLQIVVWVLKK